MTNILPTDPLDATLADFDEVAARARATACGVTGCDGSTHDAYESPEQWTHRAAQYGDEVIAWDLNIAADGHAYGWIDSPLTSDKAEEMSATEVRALADKFESVPATLRALADDLDRRNA